MFVRCDQSKKFFICLLAGGFLLSPSLSFSAPSSTNYSLIRNVINTSGGISGSTNYETQNVVGQASAVGVFNSTGFSLYAGFIPPADVDADGIYDIGDNCINDFNPTQSDNDADGQGDVCDSDDDNDGLSDAVEAILATDPLNADTDGDGLADFVEVNMDLNPLDYQAGVDTDPNDSDTDDDGLLDGFDPTPLLGGPSGDIAMDGRLNTADIAVTIRIVLGLVQATPLDLLQGDVYPTGAPDGVIDLSDLILIQQLVGRAPN